MVSALFFLKLTDNQERLILKIKNFQKNPNKFGYAYILTPKGVSEKTKLTLNFMTELSKRISDRILSSDNFENVAYVCCDWEEFVFEVAEWGVDHIAQVDFDDLSNDNQRFC